MIESYWNEMFQEFKVSEKQFVLPGFPEPLMSPHFGVTNQISESPLADHLIFKLCLFEPRLFDIDTMVKVEDLKLTLFNAKFWDFIHRHHHKSYPFMKKLIPFLIKHEKPHRHFYIEKNNHIIASCLVGETGQSLFGFNAAVAQGLRENGLSQILMKSIQGFYFPRPFFYWTKLMWLTNGADRVLYYCIKAE